MIRTGNRKNAGSRRNKRLKLHKTTNKELCGRATSYQSHQWLADMVTNHEARFVDISTLFPTGPRNLRKWQGDEAARRAAGVNIQTVGQPYWPKDENIIL